MPTSVKNSMRQTLVVMKEGNLCKKLSLPDEWVSVRILSTDQLVASIDRAITQKLKLLLIVGEDECDACLQLLKLKSQNAPLLGWGSVVISKSPSDFLKRDNLPSQLLDVIGEKDAKANIELHGLKNIRHLSLMDGLKSSKIGADTLAKLNSIFISLSAERSAEKLFEKILLKSTELTQSQWGGLYVVQEVDGENYFRSKFFSEAGKEVQFENKMVLVSENSLCGYVALTGKIQSLSDPLNQNGMTPSPTGICQYNKQFDFSIPEAIFSIITVPLKNSRDEVEAVLQLINKKDAVSGKSASHLYFDNEDESVLAAFGTQAGICLENVDLYTDVQGLFEGFVRASVKAIESRDPSTGGHSERVAKMSVGLARAITDCEEGTYRSVRFRDEEIRELEYAAMLHDFGKIGVREEVLVKAKKLHSWQLEGIRERLKICKAAAKIDFLERKLASGDTGNVGFEREYHQRIRDIDKYWEIIQVSNSPSILKQENVAALDRIRTEQLLLPDGDYIALLSEEEFKALSVKRGTLTENERLEIESHVRHTYQFLKMIPWTRDFKKLTEIAYCHHEKLDGTGYPRGLLSHEIPLQSKIMTIADIFDALTAKDRWYKDSVPIEKALDILSEEVREGKLDEALFQIFVGRKIYEVTQPKLIHQVA